MAKQALEGIKVIAFTWLVTGPLVTKFLSDHGATVIRVESHSRPELLRASPPYKDGKPGVNRSGYFNFINGNTYSVSINLGLPEGIEVARRLMLWADVVVENFRPGVLDRMGLGYDNIKKINPRVIMLSATMFGGKGPFAQQPGIGAQMVSYAGFTHITGWGDRGPTQPYGAYTDAPAPGLGTSVLMGALLRQKKTGKGQYLDLSQYETGIWFLSPLTLDWQINGRPGSRQGNGCEWACPHAAYPCRGEDAWVALAATNEAEWRSFCQVLGNPAWTKKSDFATLQSRKKNEEQLNRLIGEWTRNFTAQEVMIKMQAAGVPAGVVQNAHELYEDPQLRHQDFFWKLEHSEIGAFTHLGQQLHLSETPAEGRLPTPCLGEHTELVCRKFLGMSDEEFVDLLAKGALS